MGSLDLVRDRCLIDRCLLFEAEDGIRDLVRSRGLGDVYKRQLPGRGHRRKVLQRHRPQAQRGGAEVIEARAVHRLSLIHI